MTFQGLDKQAAQRAWALFMGWTGARPEYALDKPLKVIAIPARHFWDAAFLKKYAPGFIFADTQAGFALHPVVWTGDAEDTGWSIHGYVSESDYFLQNWQQAFWLGNYAWLARARQQYNPDGLFFVRHGVGSELWRDDGFTKVST